MSDKRIALETISEACETYGCQKVFCLFSGGDDSLAALRVAVEHPRFCAAVHCNTGIGVEATRQFARDTCRELRVPLIEYKAAENTNAEGKLDPQIYEQIVLEYGFPGPTKFGHGKMYVRLKDRGIRRLLREHTDQEENVILASGCRQEESTRRMGTTTRIQQGEIRKNGQVNEKRRIWVNHLLDWTKPQTLAFSRSCGLKRNPVSTLIGMSGECLCGGYAHEGELDVLMSHDITKPCGEEIYRIEKKVLAAGFPWRWHERPPKWWLEQEMGQMFMFEMSQYDEPGTMCQRCEIRAAWQK